MTWTTLFTQALDSLDLLGLTCLACPCAVLLVFLLAAPIFTLAPSTPAAATKTGSALGTQVLLESTVDIGEDGAVARGADEGGDATSVPLSWLIKALTLL